MKILITKQKDLDALPESFNEFTIIEIHGGVAYNRIVVKKARGNSSVEARGNSSVEARENSSIVAWENSSVVARENSSVEARENSSVEARENSSVVARGNSSVVAWENSSVVAWENSSVVARGNSSVVAYQYSMIAVLSYTVAIKYLADFSIASLRGFSEVQIIKRKDSTATVIETPSILNISFETWLERGYVFADGITQKLVSRKKIKSIEVFEVESFKKEKSFVIKKDDVFSHGKTMDEAKDSLKYKIGSRDTSEFEKWSLTDIKPVEDLIKAYRAITGACEFGTKHFCEGRELKDKYAVSEVINITSGQFGSIEFKEFWSGK